MTLTTNPNGAIIGMMMDGDGWTPSMGKFLTTIFHLTPQVLYIFGKLRQNLILTWTWAELSNFCIIQHPTVGRPQ